MAAVEQHWAELPNASSRSCSCGSTATTPRKKSQPGLACRNCTSPAPRPGHWPTSANGSTTHPRSQRPQTRSRNQLRSHRPERGTVSPRSGQQGTQLHSALGQLVVPAGSRRPHPSRTRRKLRIPRPHRPNSRMATLRPPFQAAVLPESRPARERLFPRPHSERRAAFTVTALAGPRTVRRKRHAYPRRRPPG